MLDKDDNDDDKDDEKDGSDKEDLPSTCHRFGSDGLKSLRPVWRPTYKSALTHHLASHQRIK